jgi:hypothetical protein
LQEPPSLRKISRRRRLPCDRVSLGQTLLAQRIAGCLDRRRRNRG